MFILLIKETESYFDNELSSLFLLCLLKLSHIMVFSYMSLNALLDRLLRARWFCRRPVCDPSNINTLEYSSNSIVCQKMTYQMMIYHSVTYTACRLPRQKLTWGPKKIFSRLVFIVSSDEFSSHDYFGE